MPIEDVQRRDRELRNIVDQQARMAAHLANYGQFQNQIALNDPFIRVYNLDLEQQRIIQEAYLEAAKANYTKELFEEAQLAESIVAELKEIPTDIIESNEDFTTMKLLNSFLIGADPEFVAYKKGSMLNLLNLGFPPPNTPTMKFDHAGDVLELNPSPARSSFRLIRNIRKDLVESGYTKMLLSKGVRLRAGAYIKTNLRDLGLGGHIHFDIPFCTHKEYGLLSSRDKDVLQLTPSDSAKRLSDTLDSLVNYLEKLDILPDKGSTYRRTHCNYGNFGEIRCSNQGNRVEYRTMCSWLHSPIAAMICLTAAKLVAASPYLATEHLTANVSEIKLRKFFESASPFDSDAARIVERIYEKDVKPQVEPDADLVVSWKSLSVLGA